MSATRNPLTNPDEGDVVLLPDGRFILVDFADPFDIGFLADRDWQWGGFRYRDGWEKFVKGATVVQVGTPGNWPWHSDVSARRDKVLVAPTQADSQAYLIRVRAAWLRENAVTTVWGIVV